MNKKEGKETSKILMLPQSQSLLSSDFTNPLLKLSVFLLPSRSQNILSSCHISAGYRR